MKKQFLDEEQLILDAYRLATNIFESGFHPSFIVGLWRGGSSVGIYVQECLQTLGVNADHISVRTSYRGAPHYHHMVEQAGNAIRVHGTQYLLEHLNAEDQLLIVDDVFSTGLNIQALMHKLQRHLKRNMPEQVKIATLWQRPAFRKTDFQPDYCLHETEDWLVFPYELNGLTRKEIAEHKPYLLPLLDQYQDS